jgi:hypothetical protein
MSLKQFGGVFGRNPTFNDVTIEGELILNGDTFTGLDYQGTWNASTNTPALTGGSGTTGEFYIVNVAGATDLDGITNWAVGDWAMFNGSAWQRLEGGANGNFVDLSASGNVTLGDASTDTVQVNGYMGVGGSPSSAIGLRIAPTALAGASQFGAAVGATATSAATTSIEALRVQASTAAASFTTGYAAGLFVRDPVKGAGSTITSNYGIFVDDKTVGTNNYGIASAVTSGSNKWNVYASGTARNYMAGALSVGATTDPGTGGLYVAGNTTLGDASTDTVQVNGYVGVGGAPNSSIAIFANPSALAGVSQTGIYSLPVSTSAATTVTRSFLSLPSTAAAAYTSADVVGYWAANALKGAGSTITNLHGVYIDDQTQGTNNFGVTSVVSSGSNKWNIYASGSAANYFAGDVGIGTTPSAWGLSYKGLDLAGISLGTVNTGIAGYLVQNTFFNGTNYIYKNSDRASTYVQQQGVHRWFSSASGTAGDPVTLIERANLGLTEAVFNEPGNDYDFRIESDTNTHAFFLEGSSGNVGVGTSSITSFGGSYKVLDVVGGSTSNGGYIRTGTSDGSVSGGMFSATAGVYFGSITNTDVIIRSNATERLRLGTTEAVFNDSGNDYDFRIESDTNTHAFFVDGGTGRVGIGTSSPSYNLQVASAANAATAFFSSTATPAYNSSGYNGSSARLQLVGGSASGAQTGINLSQGGAFELFIGGVQESGGAAAFVVQGYDGSAYSERFRIKSTGQLRFVPLAADPAGAETGDVYYNSGTNKLRLYDGSSWVDLN